MQEKDMKPRRTEYRGVVFDSKSEAVFARTLDLAGCDWFYHPAEYCGHVWDFLVVPPSRQTMTHIVIGESRYDFTKWVPGSPLLVEYKPAEPSATYVSELVEKIAADPLHAMVVWGSPFNDNQRSLLSDGCCYQAIPVFSHHTAPQVSVVFGITPDMPVQAMQYRFDLRCDQRPSIIETTKQQLEEFALVKSAALSKFWNWCVENGHSLSRPDGKA